MTDLAKLAVKQSRRPYALQLLKRRRMLDAELSQRMAIEMQLRTVLLRLHSARLEVKVVRALESGNAALRDILAKDLNEDRVNDVMAEVDDAIARQEEVSRALCTGTLPCRHLMFESIAHADRVRAGILRAMCCFPELQSLSPEDEKALDDELDVLLAESATPVPLAVSPPAVTPSSAVPTGPLPSAISPPTATPSTDVAPEADADVSELAERVAHLSTAPARQRAPAE